MATIAPPARTAPAVTWGIADGIATVVLDLKGQPVNVISRAVKDEFLACFAALADDARVRAVAFFSGKAENFIAGADIEEFVTLSSAAEAERLSADGQEMLDRVARFPKRSEEHTSELQSPCNLVCRLLLEKKKNSTCSH